MAEFLKLYDIKDAHQHIELLEKFKLFVKEVVVDFEE